MAVITASFDSTVQQTLRCLELQALSRQSALNLSCYRNSCHVVAFRTLCVCCLLCLQERYRGRAQIASSGFQQPATVAAELLLFGPDCFGVVWGAPLSMFSLFSRVEDAAALPAV